MVNPARVRDWRQRARCRDEDPELFFPVGTTGPAVDAQVASARAVCRACPVRRDCLAWALAAGEPAGVWGGLTADERRVVVPASRVGASS